jgi:hypothetical protein
MDEQAKINKDVVTKFGAMEKILENLDGTVTEVENSIREVLIVMKMLETQVGQLVRRPMGNKRESPRQSQGPETAKPTQTCHMDLPGPTASVGTRTDYSVGPWDYSTCATRHLMAWGTRTMVEKYSNRKLHMSCTM